MLTGVETAGILLGAFPFCIELIKLYARGADLLGEILRHHHRVLREFQRELNMESCKFYNCLLNLFEDTLTEQDCVRFFQDPKGAEEQLKALLDRPGVAGIFIDAVGALQEELNELRSQFPVDKDVVDKIAGKHVEAGSREYLKLCRRAGKKLKKRFTLALLKEEHSNRMKNIRNINEDLDRLVNGARQCATNLSTSRANLSAIENHYKLVRDGAQSVCNILRQRIEVPHGCACDHGVSLCLDMREAERRDGYGTGMRRKAALKFRLLFCLAGGKLEDVTSTPPVPWKELEAEPIFGSDDESEGDQQHTDSCHRDKKSAQRVLVQSSRKRVVFESVTKVGDYCLEFLRIPISDSSISGESQPPTMTAHQNGSPVSQGRNHPNRSAEDRMSNAGPHLIHDVCKTITRSIQTTKRQSLGFLTTYGEKLKLRLWSLPVGDCFGLAGIVQCPEWRSKPVSLFALLQDHISNGSHGYPMMKLRDRLSLGIKLASSVIQLHQTPWLNESWSKQDIVFFVDPRTRHPLIENPMVLHNLSAPPSDLTQQQWPGIVRRNKLLFSLGVVLWKLWFWRRLEDDPDLKAHLTHGQLSDNMPFAIAGIAFQKLDGDASLKYCDAVRTCFFDNIPTGGHGFSTIVWQKVLCSLQENYSAYAHT
ncbi:hypothetical protein BGX38DRAFT_1265212 [Terfezia claveryi]|nr:hypothetical protein BGX38DRAFT_1265212 [Terfezia claveryi]